MPAPEADLTGWACEPFSAAGFTHDVYRRGQGPGVVLIPEMPGAHPGVFALGNYLVDNGFTVAIPSLFGYNYIGSLIKNTTADMHIFVDEFIGRITEEHSR